MKKIKYPGVLGLAFVSPEVLAIVLDKVKYTTCIYPSEEYKSWLEHEYKDRDRIILMKERGKDNFLKLLKIKNVSKIITFCGLTWMKNRNIDILDAEDQDDHVICKQHIKPSFLLAAIAESEPYQKSEIDIWKTKGKPKKGVRDKARGLEQNNLYTVYSLANLLHIISSKIDETVLLLPLKRFWEVTYQFAMGKMKARDWSNRYGRSLKTAGVPSNDLKQVILWVKKWKKNLKTKKLGRAVSPLDLKLATRFRRIQ